MFAVSGNIVKFASGSANQLSCCKKINTTLHRYASKGIVSRFFCSDTIEGLPTLGSYAPFGIIHIHNILFNAANLNK